MGLLGIWCYMDCGVTKPAPLLKPCKGLLQTPACAAVGWMGSGFMLVMFAAHRVQPVISQTRKISGMEGLLMSRAPHSASLGLSSCVCTVTLPLNSGWTWTGHSPQQTAKTPRMKIRTTTIRWWLFRSILVGRQVPTRQLPDPTRSPLTLPPPPLSPTPRSRRPLCQPQPLPTTLVRFLVCLA